MLIRLVMLLTVTPAYSFVFSRDKTDQYIAPQDLIIVKQPGKSCGPLYTRCFTGAPALCIKLTGKAGFFKTKVSAEMKATNSSVVSIEYNKTVVINPVQILADDLVQKGHTVFIT